MESSKNKPVKIGEERIGEFFIISETIIYALFPIIINYSVKILPPIFFASISTLTACIPIVIYILFTKKFHELWNKKAFLPILGVTIFIIILPSLFIYTGTKTTSGINTSILLQMEILFTPLICGIFFHQKITKQILLSALLIFIGAMAVLYNGEMTLNKGDIFILIGTALYPIGNVFAKKALTIVSPQTIVFLRSFLGGISLLIIAFLLEKNLIPQTVNQNAIIMIFLNGVLIMALTKILFYEGLRRLDISKSITISMSYPALSLVFAMIFLNEIPTVYQILGLVIIMVGLYFSTRKSKISSASNVA